MSTRLARPHPARIWQQCCGRAACTQPDLPPPSHHSASRHSLVGSSSAGHAEISRHSSRSAMRSEGMRPSDTSISAAAISSREMPLLSCSDGWARQADGGQTSAMQLTAARECQKACVQMQVSRSGGRHQAGAEGCHSQEGCISRARAGMVSSERWLTLLQSPSPGGGSQMQSAG